MQCPPRLLSSGFCVCFWFGLWGLGLVGSCGLRVAKEGETYLMMWPGCVSALIRGMTSHGFSSFDVQNGCDSGTARHMNARHAQYCSGSIVHVRTVESM